MTEHIEPFRGGEKVWISLLKSGGKLVEREGRGAGESYPQQVTGFADLSEGLSTVFNRRWGRLRKYSIIMEGLWTSVDCGYSSNIETKGLGGAGLVDKRWIKGGGMWTGTTLKEWLSTNPQFPQH